MESLLNQKQFRNGDSTRSLPSLQSSEHSSIFREVMTSFKELFLIKNSQFLCPNTQLMRTYDTRAFYIPDPAPDRRSVSTTSADEEEDDEETSHTAETRWRV